MNNGDLTKTTGDFTLKNQDKIKEIHGFFGLSCGEWII